MSDHIEKCPICGGKSTVIHMKADGFDFGFDCGCAKFCINDGIHNINFDTPQEMHPKVTHWERRTCIRLWNEKAKRMKEEINGTNRERMWSRNEGEQDE